MCEGGCAKGGFANLVDVVALGVVRAKVFEQQIAVARDHGQEVVEIVGDPSGQATDRLHLLRLAQPLLGLPECFLASLTLDADRQGTRDRAQRLGHELG